MLYKKIEIGKGKFIGDYQSELNAWIDGLPKESWSLIKAPTESGKSTAIKNYFNHAPHRKKVLLCPTQSLVLNLEDGSSKSGFGWEWLEYNKQNQELLTTYDSLAHLENVDDVFIDEGHLLSGHASFRECLQTIIEAKGCRIILMSGTAEIIENIEGLHIIEFTKEEPFKREVSICGEKGFRSKSAIIGICEKAISEIQDIRRFDIPLERVPIKMIRINCKKTIDEVYELFKDRIRIAKFYSDSDIVLNASQDEAMTNDLKKGKIRDIDLLLVTSIYDAGLSLDVDRDVDCYAVSNSKDFMPNAIDMLQLVARVRANSGHKMSLTILGGYGSEFINDEVINLNDSPKAILNTLDYKYSQYAFLNEDDYRAVIQYYGVKVNVLSEQPFNNIKEKSYVSKERNITIAKNLKGFGLLYDDLMDKAKEFDRRLELDEFTGGDKQFRGLTSEIQRIFNRVYDCLENDIHLSLLMDREFRGDKIENLSKLVNSYKTSNDDVFLRIISELIDGVDGGGKVDLEGFDILNSVYVAQIKTLGGLLYERCRWNRKSFKLTPKGELIKERKYLRMINSNVVIIEELINKTEYCIESGFELVRIANDLIKSNSQKMCEPMPMNSTPYKMSDIDFSYFDNVEPYNWNEDSVDRQINGLVNACADVVKLERKVESYTSEDWIDLDSYS